MFLAAVTFEDIQVSVGRAANVVRIRTGGKYCCSAGLRRIRNQLVQSLARRACGDVARFRDR